MVYAVNPKVYSEVKNLALRFQTATPFPHIVIDNFLNESVAEALLKDFPDTSAMYCSRHYIFGKKYEISGWSNVSSSFHLLHEELLSQKFQSFMSEISGDEVFIDSQFCGHLDQGVNGSYLDLHTDFNFHPLCDTWLHKLNLLIYLNKSWKQEYGGDLQLRGSLNGDEYKISPLFNRCVILLMDDNTFHGYSRMTLPKGVTRKSISVHFYKEESPETMPPKRTTTWAVNEKSILKRSAAKLFNPAVLLKNSLLGSFTTRRNQEADGGIVVNAKKQR